MSESLESVANRLLTSRGWHWPPVSAHPRIGPRPFIEDQIVPAFVADLSPALAALVREKMIVRVARLASPHAWLQPHEAGMIILVHGGLFLLLYDLVGCIYNNLEFTTVGPGKIKGIVAASGLALVRRLAGVLWMFLDRPTSVGPDLMPPPTFVEPPVSSPGELIIWGLRFCVAHEVGHALVKLGEISDTEGMRQVFQPTDLPEETIVQWEDELFADQWATAMCLDASRRRGGGAGETGTAIFLVLEMLELLERVLFLPSSYAHPVDPTDPPDLNVFGDHPPVAMRRHVVDAVLEPYGIDWGTKEQLYQDALRALVDRLDHIARNGCIAPLDREATILCKRGRADHGWYCDRHQPKV